MSTAAPARERVTCRRCGRKTELHWSAQTNKYLREERLCFDCGYWVRIIETEHEPHTQAIIDGKHFTILPDCPPYAPRLFAGFSGVRFVIEFDDGTVVETRNLWTQGEIPGKFRRQLKDNATFRSA